MLRAWSADGISRVPRPTLSYTKGVVMALVTTGLTNNGRTTHYQIQYDDSLSQADGRDRANGLIAACEADYAKMAGWFDNIGLTVGIPITVNITPGSYASAGWGPPIRLTPGNGSDLTLVRYLLVSEVTEMFMLAQNRGWFGAGNEGSAGEGLSRFLAAQFLIENGLGVTEPGFQLANYWMSSPRADYVNNVDVLDHGLDAKTGCAILFIYYLHSQLDYSTHDIVQAAAPELSGVYQNLTGFAGDPFPAFKALLDTYYPGTTTIPGSNPDNPFPLGLRLKRPRIDELVTWVSWGVKVDGGGPTGHGPVPPWSPFIRQLAAGFALAEAADLVSPELRGALSELAARQVALASESIAAEMVKSGEQAPRQALMAPGTSTVDKTWRPREHIANSSIESA